MVLRANAVPLIMVRGDNGGETAAVRIGGITEGATAW
jgi:hypothetical protein